MGWCYVEKYEPVGSKMRSLRARALRRTASFQDPVYVDWRIQSYQYLLVVYMDAILVTRGPTFPGRGKTYVEQGVDKFLTEAKLASRMLLKGRRLYAPSSGKDHLVPFLLGLKRQAYHHVPF